MDLKSLGSILKEAGSSWVQDKAPRLGAALAYYTIFSLAPLLVITLAVSSLFFKQNVAQGRLVEQIESLVGPKGGEAIRAMLESASQPGSGGALASVLGVAMLLFGAAGLFGELQDALNTIWEVKPKPGRGVWGVIRSRFMSLSMVLGVSFLLLVSLVISTVLSAMGGLLGDWPTGIVGQIVQTFLDVTVITLLFAMIYRFLPDVQIAWRDVWLGAAVTAVLFVLGKFLIGLYLGRSTVASAFGAAGSLAVLLVWLYYSAQIFLFGAEFTKAYARARGGVVPAPNAEPVTAEARAQQGLPRPADRPQPAA